MSIVFITVSGDEKKIFANALHEKTKGGIELVIIQRAKSLSFFQRLKRLYNRIGLLNLPKELWYAILLRINGSKDTLEYFRTNSVSHSSEYIPKVIFVDSVNSDEVYEMVKKISPNLLVIWGSAILAPRLLETAKNAINLHMGYSPFYRGALANQHAVLLGDYNHVGSTIHYAEKKVDSGNIIARLLADYTKAPKEMFQDLNDRTIALYLEIAIKIFMGQSVPSIRQDVSKSKNLLLKEWVPSVRYALGHKMLELEKKTNKINYGSRQIPTKQ